MIVILGQGRDNLKAQMNGKNRKISLEPKTEVHEEPVALTLAPAISSSLPNDGIPINSNTKSLFTHFKLIHFFKIDLFPGSIVSAVESSATMFDLKLERATSTTMTVTKTTTTTIPETNPQTIAEAVSPKSMSTDPAEWSIDDVMRYLSSIDAGLNVHAQLFHKHVSSALVHTNVSQCFIQ